LLLGRNVSFFEDVDSVDVVTESSRWSTKASPCIVSPSTSRVDSVVGDDVERFDAVARVIQGSHEVRGVDDHVIHGAKSRRCPSPRSRSSWRPPMW